MQKVWEVIDDDTGAIKITILADSNVQGVTISNTPDWQYQTDINHIVSLLGQASVWIDANKGGS